MNRECGSRRPLLRKLLLALPALLSSRTHAEDRLDYKFEDYQEEDDRIHVQTHSAMFEKQLNAALTLKAEYVYDGISGATPTGAPPPAGSKQVVLTHMDDTRNAGSIELALRLGKHTFRPQFAVSIESDYTSYGVSLGDTIEFNEKNTIILLGIAHNFDYVEPEFWTTAKHKDSTDALVGVSQLLDPRTIFTANLTLGYSDGYLADPYKRVRFDDYPDPTGTFAEVRPGHKFKQVIYLALTHHFDKLNASSETAYRFYHDSFGIDSHTVGLTWYQKIGKYVTVAPMFRYYYQTAADFYGVTFPGDPSDPDNPTPIPDYYSADYRLSEMQTFTYGVKLVVQINDHLRLDAAYKRYDMQGLDNTPDSAYPQANVFTLGASWQF